MTTPDPTPERIQEIREHVDAVHSRVRFEYDSSDDPFHAAMEDADDLTADVIDLLRALDASEAERERLYQAGRDAVRVMSDQDLLLTVTKVRAETAEARVQVLEDALRMEWWMNHGHPPMALYGDDGEMQCNFHGCFTDFKREPMETLRALVDAFRLGAAQEAMKKHAEESA